MNNRCHAGNCVLDAMPGFRHCRVHEDACLAREMRVPPATTCRKCRSVIREEDLVSRKMGQEKHKKTKATIFYWQHAHCVPPVRPPTKAMRRKAVKPLFAEL